MGFFNRKSKGIDYIQQKYGVTPPDLSNSNKDLLFTIYDRTQKKFIAPFPCPTVDACKFSIVQLYDKGDNFVKKYPTQFELYQIGYFDSQSGKVETCDITHICNLSSIIKSDVELPDFMKEGK